MDFSQPPEAEALRAELHGWLEANLDDRARASASSWISRSARRGA